MAKIRDYICKSQELPNVTGQVNFPEVHLKWKDMAEMSIRIRREYDMPYCELPFCHTIEAEALGANIRYGDKNAGPRAAAYVYKDFEEIVTLSNIDFSRGRIKELLQACEYLLDQRERVVLQVTGAFTILTTLMDPQRVFVQMRKKPILFEQVMRKIEADLLKFLQEAFCRGVRYVSYAEPVLSVSILGTSMVEKLMKDHIHPFLKKVETFTPKELRILLCPKIFYALVDTEKAKIIPVLMESEQRYVEICVHEAIKAKFMGQMCLKNRSYVVKDRLINIVELNE